MIGIDIFSSTQDKGTVCLVVEGACRVWLSVALMSVFLPAVEACHEQGVPSHFLARSLQRLGDERTGPLGTTAPRPVERSRQSGRHRVRAQVTVVLSCLGTGPRGYHADCCLQLEPSD